MAEDINIAFCRRLLKSVFADVQKHFPNIRHRDAWVYHFRRDSWEFHGPDKFYWHGSADNAYDARHKGWTAYLRHKGIKDYADVDDE